MKNEQRKTTTVVQSMRRKMNPNAGFSGANGKVPTLRHQCQSQRTQVRVQAQCQGESQSTKRSRSQSQSRSQCQSQSQRQQQIQSQCQSQSQNQMPKLMPVPFVVRCPEKFKPTTGNSNLNTSELLNFKHYLIYTYLVLVNP